MIKDRPQGTLPEPITGMAPTQADALWQQALAGMRTPRNQAIGQARNVRPLPALTEGDEV
jgi:hypothetical protein